MDKNTRKAIEALAPHMAKVGRAVIIPLVLVTIGALNGVPLTLSVTFHFHQSASRFLPTAPAQPTLPTR